MSWSEHVVDSRAASTLFREPRGFDYLGWGVCLAIAALYYAMDRITRA